MSPINYSLSVVAVGVPDQYTHIKVPYGVTITLFVYGCLISATTVLGADVAANVDSNVHWLGTNFLILCFDKHVEVRDTDI